MLPVFLGRSVIFLCSYRGILQRANESSVVSVVLYLFATVTLALGRSRPTSRVPAIGKGRSTTPTSPGRTKLEGMGVGPRVKLGATARVRRPTEDKTKAVF